MAQRTTRQTHLRPRGPRMHSTVNSVMLVTAAVAVVGLLGCVRVGHAASAANIFGFCQDGYGGSVTGGWTDAAPDSCFLGMFGKPGIDGSIFDTDTIPCEISNDTMASTCNCLKVPQCGRGTVCNFDCGCTLPTTAAATALDSYFASKTTLNFTGTITLPLSGTTASVSCGAAVPADGHIVGYTLYLLGTNAASTCTDGSGQSNNANYTCRLELEVSDSPLLSDQTFSQQFRFDSAATLATISRVFVLLLVSCLCYALML